MSRLRLAVEVLRWSLAWWLLWRVPRPRAEQSPSTRRVSVIVPARDEEANLGRLLPSLAGAGHLEVVVVDDGSVDATADVARQSGSTLVQPGEPPAGWTGKAWACAAGAARARGDLLVFLDADTVVLPGGLARIVAEHDRHGGLVSVQPIHVPERPHEQLSAYFNVIAMMGVDAFTPLGSRRRPVGAFGPCLVVDRTTYEACGGHEGVRGEVIDDVALARAAASAGAKVTLLGGRGSLAFRMYPESLGQLVEGWTKNIAGGAAGTRPVTLLLVVAWVSGAITAAVGPVLLPFPVAACLYAAYATQLGLLLRRVGRFSPATPVLFPVPLAFFLAVFARSAALTVLRRRVVWRGRFVTPGRAR